MTGAPRHYMTGTVIHNTWKGMMTRCYNKNRKQYKDYGGRGITVCDKWLIFENFMEDMGSDWFEGATLERIDNDAGYSPDNCTWVYRSEQNANRRPSSEWSYKKEPRAGSSTGVKGVSLDRTRGLYQVVIRTQGKYKHVGRFQTVEEARAAYERAICQGSN